MSSDLQFNNAENLMIKGDLDSLQEGIKTAEYKYGTIQNKETFLDKLLFMGAAVILALLSHSKARY